MTQTKMESIERWCKIEGWDNYSVSDFGQIRNDKTGRILKENNYIGYNQVGLTEYGYKTNHRIHRLVATSFCENENKYNVVDHIDNDKQNNHYTNLRWVTISQNKRNSLKRNGTSSKYIGVHFYKPTNKWRAQIIINYKKKHLGYFDTEDEAHQAFRAAVTEYGLEEFYPIENNINL